VWRGDLEVAQGALVNEGTILSSSATQTHDHVNQLTAEVNNRGTLRTERVLTINKANVIHRNTGTIEVSGGNLAVTQSGELAAFIQNGTLALAANRVLTISGSTVFLQGGSIGGVPPAVLEGPARLQFTNTTVNLAVDLTPEDMDLWFTSSIVHGPGKLYTAVGYALTVSGTTVNADVHNRGTVETVGTSTFAGSTFTNPSTARLRVLGNAAIGHVALTIAQGFTNYGEIELGNSAHVWRGDLTISQGTLINEGLVRSSSVVATNDHVNILAAEFVNNGTLLIERVLRLSKADARHVNMGSVHLVSGNLTADLASNAEFHNAGRITVHQGRTLTFTGGSLTHAPGGVFHGSGTVSISGTSVNNSGGVAPGLRPMFGHNLLVNGDAEMGPIGASTANVVISGWSDSGPMSILPYDFEDTSQPYLASTDPGAPNPGRAYFWGGVGPSSTITQTINLTDIRSLVDLGSVPYDLSGWLGGFSVQNDQMELTASFRDANNDVLASATIGPVTAVDRGLETKLLFRRVDGFVPVGTRSVILTLSATRFAGTANNGFADNLSLVLFHPDGHPDGRTTGILAVTGDLPMDPQNARIEIAIGGATVGEQHDQVAVSGVAHLTGRLHAVIINSYVPPDGTDFVVMGFGSRVGEFSEVTVAGLPEGISITPIYSSTSVILRSSGEAVGPSQPVLVSPADGATGVGSSPTLRWNSAAGATSYHLQLSTAANFSAIVFEDEDVTTTQVDPGELGDGTHYWRVRASDGTHLSPWSHVAQFNTTFGVSSDEGPTGPLVFSLDPNYPNPFAGHTTIPFVLAQDGHVRLELFDLLGRRVAMLADGDFAAGRHEARVDASALPSGAYVYRLSAGDLVAVRKMLLVRR
jgi:hypothetical protein